MNTTILKSIRETLRQWSSLTDGQKGPGFEMSVERLTKWMNDLEKNENEKR